MILIVGLGNPETKHEKTRHNVGFRVIDALENKLSDKNIILFKPPTYMNNSGKAIKPLTTKYKMLTTNIIVIHDDIDLPLGTIRISKNSSSGGHKGVQSIIDALGTKNFTRIRVGIRPAEKPAASFASGRARQNKNFLAGFVLEQFTKDEKKIIEKIIEKVVEIIKESLKIGIKKTTITIG